MLALWLEPSAFEMKVAEIGEDVNISRRPGSAVEKGSGRVSNAASNLSFADSRKGILLRE